ncbi:polysaccharide biosynthesis/export family protein [Paraburkholderia sp. SARCC-3016]|uniref:polysaccharide biosynthesis/export family protein n=1 Tax=Paraburkholderia sp. SARCC-3016 TaxID=3058611 RepID=UPI0028072675|nr:polysaccharide biosynthesis/export family protein [Paraburkholderia sp. SARCC-3016]MDQ7977197.1 polysaccharide biosynthesis/export family protein [Paraburkholderia sp. SARCC-3016]
MLKRNITCLFLFALTIFLSACSVAPGNHLDTSRLNEQPPSGPAPTYDVKVIDAQLVVEQAKFAAAMAPAPLPPSQYTLQNYVYHVEPQDILGVTVWNHPELTTQSGTSLSTGGNTTQTISSVLQQPYTTALPGQADPFGQTVSPDGTIFFPFVGRIRAAGKTTTQIRDELSIGLRPFIKDPQVDVRVLAFRSQRVEVTGEVKTPGPLAISDVPLKLVDAITRSGGTNPDADLQRVRLTRNQKLYILNADAMLDRGDTSQDVLLQPGDVLNVPDRTDSRIFVMGEVKSPATLSMLKGRFTIADALTGAGGILDTDANPRQIFVMRGMRDNPTSPEIFRLDMTQPDAVMLSSQFQLKPLDVVYVGTAAGATFNRMIQQILPALQSVFFIKELTN